MKINNFVEIFLPNSWVPLKNFDVTVQKVSKRVRKKLLILGESEALLGVWRGWRGSSENEGKGERLLC